MLFPADHLLKAVAREIGQLNQSGANAVEGSSLQSLGIALKLLAAREQGGIGTLNAQRRHLDDALAAVGSHLPPHSALALQVTTLRQGLAPADPDSAIDSVEASWRDVLAGVQRLSSAIAGSESLPAATRERVAAAFVAWECADLQAQLGGDADTGASADAVVTQSRWRDYLRDRYDDPSLDVTSFKSLAGGFGKQTYLFEVSGTKLNGAYVLRRDLAVTLFDNDCHRIEKEYALIRAVFDKGFPAPEAVWLDTEHRLLPGGHFLVMRRSPGVPGGSVFQAQAGVPKDLAETLATILARLHTLPPLTEVGSLTESIAPELWRLPINEVVRRYLVNWRELFEREAHFPSPAIASLFGWLLDHIPESSGTTSLLHGDIGFHNFLFDDGKLQAVLDWEFGHIGDPAEDLAYVRNTLGGSLDWDVFIAAYRAAGGAEVSVERLHFFQVWGHVRNACASNLVSAKLYDRQIDDLKVIVLPHAYIPQFLKAAQAMIQSGRV